MAIQQINTLAELRFTIQQLEMKQANEWPPLKEQLLASAEMLKPRHIIKDAFKEIFSPPALKATAVNSTLGMAALHAAYFFFSSKTTGQLTKFVTGTIVGVTTIGKAINNGGQIKLLGNSLLKRLSKKKPTL